MFSGQYHDGPVEFASEEFPGTRWCLDRVKVLGKGSFGLASLVKDSGSSAYRALQAAKPAISKPTAKHGRRAETAEKSAAEEGDQSENLFVLKEVNVDTMKSDEELNSLLKETQILRSVQHPNIVHFVDSFFDRENGYLVILMEYCDGGDLGQLVKTASERKPCGGLSEDEICSLLIQLTMALKHLHCEHHILHRDLKPENVFVTTDGRFLIGDFGISTVLTSSVDCARTFCGSPYYLAPELCQEKPYNGKADLWSLGCILYEAMARGERAFRGGNLMALVRNICMGAFTPLDAVVGPAPRFHDYSLEMKRVVGSLLKQEPEQRTSVIRLLRLPHLLQRVATCLPPRLRTDPTYVAEFPFLASQSGISAVATGDAQLLGKAMSQGKYASDQFERSSNDDDNEFRKGPACPPNSTVTSTTSTRAAHSTTSHSKNPTFTNTSIAESEGTPFFVHHNRANFDITVGGGDSMMSSSAASTMVPHQSPDNQQPETPSFLQQDMPSYPSAPATWEGSGRTQQNGQQPQQRAKSTTPREDGGDEYADDFEQVVDEEAEAVEARVYANWALKPSIPLTDSSFRM